MAGRPLRRMHINPIPSDLDEALIVTRSNPPGWVALVSAPTGDFSLWLNDSPPAGVQAVDAKDGPEFVREYKWRAHPDVAESVSVNVSGVYRHRNEYYYAQAYMTPAGERDPNRTGPEPRMQHAAEFMFILEGLDRTLQYLGRPAVDVSKFARFLSDTGPKGLDLKVSGSGRWIKAVVTEKRQKPYTPAAWADLGWEKPTEVWRLNAVEAQGITDKANDLLKAFYEAVQSTVAAAVAEQSGQAPQSRYSVVLTYKGIVLEAIPVETQQDAIDAMTAMQGELRIKTVKGSSSKGAKANPYNGYRGDR